MPRRPSRFLIVALVILVVLVSAIITIVVSFSDYLQWTPIQVEQPHPSTPRLHQVDDEPFYLVWIDQTPIALSTRDPNPSGCPIRWDDQEQMFVEPCLGSRYFQDGSYKYGPSPRSMDRFAIRVVGNQIQVNVTKRQQGLEHP